MARRWNVSGKFTLSFVQFRINAVFYFINKIMLCSLNVSCRALIAALTGIRRWIEMAIMNTVLYLCIPISMLPNAYLSPFSYEFQHLISQPNTEFTLTILTISFCFVLSWYLSDKMSLGKIWDECVWLKVRLCLDSFCIIFYVVDTLFYRRLKTHVSTEER